MHHHGRAVILDNNDLHAVIQHEFADLILNRSMLGRYKRQSNAKR